MAWALWPNAERFRRMTSHPEVVAHMDGQLPESPLIVERPRQAFGFAETAEDPLEFSERKECSSQVEAKIDGLLQPLAGLGQMRAGPSAPARSTSPPPGWPIAPMP